MILKNHFMLMADYNQRMNRQVYEASSKLTVEDLNADRGAFFSSILATLNHILVGDLIWLARFSTFSANYRSLAGLDDLPKPEGLDEIVYPDLSQLLKVRHRVDSSICLWLKEEVIDIDFGRSLVYANTKGIESERIFGELVSHLFNHQTHHRGQITTLLSQQGIDIGSTDFLIDIPNMKA